MKESWEAARDHMDMDYRHLRLCVLFTPWFEMTEGSSVVQKVFPGHKNVL